MAYDRSMVTLLHAVGQSISALHVAAKLYIGLGLLLDDSWTMCDSNLTGVIDNETARNRLIASPTHCPTPCILFIILFRCTETGEFGVRGETLGPPNPGRVSSALEMKL